MINAGKILEKKKFKKNQRDEELISAEEMRRN